jgi:hypothetical protein
MQLWSWQGRDFSLLEGRVEFTKSPYVETVPGLLEAYQRVWKHVGRDQIVWCWTRPDEHIDVDTTEVKWSLEVPESEILTLIDDFVWSRILYGDRVQDCHPPRRLQREWWDRALEVYPDDSESRTNFLKKQHQDYWNQEPPSGDWWNHVFVNDTNRDSTSAIIPHPIKREWVVS